MTTGAMTKHTYGQLSKIVGVESGVDKRVPNLSQIPSGDDVPEKKMDVPENKNCSSHQVYKMKFCPSFVWKHAVPVRPLNMPGSTEFQMSVKRSNLNSVNEQRLR